MNKLALLVVLIASTIITAAIVLFVLILPLIMCCPPVDKDITAESRTLLSNLVNSPGTLQHTDTVKLIPNLRVSAVALAERIPLSEEQVCFSKGAFYEDESFRAIGEPVNKILYNGDTDKQVKVAVICQRGIDKLKQDMDTYAEMENHLSSNYLESCACTNEQTCCALILETA